jgi:hypothetical protein
LPVHASATYGTAVGSVIAKPAATLAAVVAWLLAMKS